MTTTTIYTTWTDDGILVNIDDLRKSVYEFNRDLEDMFPEGRTKVLAHDDWATKELSMEVSWASLGAVSTDIARQQAAAIEYACQWIDAIGLNGAKVTSNDKYMSPELKALRAEAL